MVDHTVSTNVPYFHCNPLTNTSVHALTAPVKVKAQAAALIHSLVRKSSLVQQANMKVELLPALTDNYMYLLIDAETKEAAVVDPVEPVKVGPQCSPLCVCLLLTLSRASVGLPLHRPTVALLLQVIEAVRKHGVRLTTVLTTHHHW